jgi:ribosomal protein S18 acetylase RimI-like enzyme
MFKRKEHEQFLLNPTYHIQVQQEDKKNVATISFQCYGNNAYITALRVQPFAQRKHIGTRLLYECLLLLKQSEIEHVDLYTLETLDKKIIKNLYVNNGFMNVTQDEQFLTADVNYSISLIEKKLQMRLEFDHDSQLQEKIGNLTKTVMIENVSSQRIVENCSFKVRI